MLRYLAHSVLGIVMALAALTAPSPALADRPSIERFRIDRTTTEGFLSESCGYTILQTIRGHVTTLTFGDPEETPLQVTIRALRLTYSANGKTYTVVEVGPTKTQFGPGEDRLYLRAGQTALGWIGLELVRVEDGVVVKSLNAGRGQVYRVDVICEALA